MNESVGLVCDFSWLWVSTLSFLQCFDTGWVTGGHPVHDKSVSRHQLTGLCVYCDTASAALIMWSSLHDNLYN